MIEPTDEAPQSRIISRDSVKTRRTRFIKVGQTYGKEKTFLEDVWQDERFWNDQNVWGS